MKAKTINTREFKLLFKHRKLIASAASRGYSVRAIYELVLDAERSAK